MTSETLPTASPIIVALDPSERGRDALALGRLLARVTGLPLLLTTVCSIGDEQRAGAMLELARREVASETEASTIALTGGSAARALEELSRATDAAMIVVGSTHRGGIGRVLPGSTAEQLLRSGACPVAVAPRSFAAVPAPSIRRVGAAFLDTREGWAAVTAGHALAAAAGKPLRLLGVLGPSAWADAPGQPGNRELHAALRAGARQVLLNASTALPDDVRVERKLLEGRPGRALALASRRLDLLVLGSSGHGLFGRALGNGASSALLNGAVCPVIAVPRNGADALLRASQTVRACSAA